MSVDEFGDEIRSEGNDESVGDDSKFANGVQNSKPNTNVFYSLRNGTAVVGEEFFGVQPHLQRVIDKGKERCEGE